MNNFVESFAYWLADYYLATTLLLSAALVAMLLMKQPVKRMAIMKSTLLALVLLAVLCAMPGWSLVHLATSWAASERPTQVESLATSAVQLTRVPTAPTFAPEASMADAARPTAASAAPRITFTWPSVLLAVCMLGSVIAAVRLAIGALFAHRLLRMAKPAPIEVDNILATVLNGASSRPRLLVSQRIDVAAALGLWRPTILLPISWIDGRAADGLRTVLAHECAHIRNGDLRCLAVGRVLGVILWLQPLVWMFRRRLRLDQEALADAAAAEEISSRQKYAEQLVAWARAMPPRPRTALASAVGLWEGPSQLRRRVSLLLDEHFSVLRECSRRLRWASLLVCGLIALVLSMVTFQPTLSDPTTDSGRPERVVLGDRFVLCKATTDLERSLLGNAAQPKADVSACLFVNLSAFGDAKFDANSPSIKELSALLAKWAENDNRSLLTRVYVGPVPNNTPNSEWQDREKSFAAEFEKLGSAAGYQRVSSSWVHAGAFDWTKFVQSAESLAKWAPPNAEQATGDDRVKVFAVQTFLSRLLVNADCVVNILPTIEQAQAQNFPGEFQNSLNQFVPQLRCDRKETILLRVCCTDSAGDRLETWINNRQAKEKFATQFGFKTCNLERSYVAEPDRSPRMDDITGQVVLPDGQPAVGVSVNAFSMSDPDKLFEPYGYQRGTTDEEGRFRLAIYSGGREVFWILPRDYVQQTHVLNDRRGDLGTFKLETGLYFHGRVVDQHAKPIGNVWVNAELVDGPAKQKIEMPVSDNIERAELTDANGGFDLGPLPAGIYRVGPDEMPADDFRNLDESRRMLPAAFLPQRIELTAASELEEIEIKPVDSARIEVHFVDSRGNPTDAIGFSLVGTGPDGQRIGLRRGPVWRGQSHRQVVSFDVPKGLTRTVVDFPRSSMRVRRSPSESWENDFSLDLGTLDRDWREIEAVRYRTPVLVVTANDAAGNAIADFKPAIFYHYRDQQEPRKDRWIDDVRGDVDLEPRPNGGWQSESLLPDEEFTLTVSADGYQTFEENRSSKEGQFQQVKAVLKPLGSDSDTHDSTSTSGTESTKDETQHTVSGVGTTATFVAGNPATPWDFKPNVLALTVEDAAGKALEGVEAIVYRVAPQSGERVLAKRSTTDSKGEVEFVGLVDAERAAEFQARAAKSQFPLVQGDIFYTVLKRPGLATLILPASDFTLAGRGVKRSVRMRPAAELSGRVTDRESKPVEGATVAAGSIAGFFVLEGVNAVKTDADGRYRFSDRVAFNREAANKRIAEQNRWALAADRDLLKMYPAVYDPAEDTSVSDLYVTHPDFAVTTVRGGDVPGMTDVVMAPGAAIEGRVVEFGTGKPVAGIRVQTVGQPTPTENESSPTADVSGGELFLDSWHNASTQTDAAGAYQLANLPEGSYEVWAEEASDDGRVGARVSRGVVGIAASGGGPATKAPDLVMGPGGVIRGRLLDAATGKPLEVGDVKLTAKAVTQLVEPFRRQNSPLATVPVDRDGRFELRTLPGALRVFLIVNTNQADSNPQGDFRSSDGAFEMGPVFDLKHDESVDAEFPVWPRAKLEEARAALIRGFERLNQQKYDDAIAAFDAAIGQEPRNESAIRARAEAYERAGRLAEATAEFERIVATSSDGYSKIIMMNNLASLLATNPNAGERDGKRAVELSTQAIAMSREASDGFPGMAELLDTLASGQAEAGDFDAAVATQRKAIGLAPEQSQKGMRERLKLYEAREAYRRPIERTVN